jgi:hypothetical protein
MTVVENIAARPPSTCRGSAEFTGTVNWAQMSLSTARIVLDCGHAINTVTVALVRAQ